MHCAYGSSFRDKEILRLNHYFEIAVFELTRYHCILARLLVARVFDTLSNVGLRPDFCKVLNRKLANLAKYRKYSIHILNFEYLHISTNYRTQVPSVGHTNPSFPAFQSLHSHPILSLVAQNWSKTLRHSTGLTLLTPGQSTRNPMHPAEKKGKDPPH